MVKLVGNSSKRLSIDSQFNYKSSQGQEDKNEDDDNQSDHGIIKGLQEEVRSKMNRHMAEAQQQWFLNEFKTVSYKGQRIDWKLNKPKK